MLQLIEEIVYQVTGKNGLTYDTDFVQDLALNSFDVMNIIGKFEDHFDTTIPTRDVWHLHQVKDVIDYLAGRGFTQP
ncbi:acyl carrier protein [Oscillibacter sp.]|uniref:acyl carrier protein n=1 Tax=Oscillibacter sp. TaxID=1945593 RepID=UPI0026185D4A|nr:phosphopantetheine-binding protein [Oscillibacter sp.]MDD3347419.1 phosphopantetheine-binding protein [Oscillibacter sp.]